jgi:hypothetical protein
LQIKKLQTLEAGVKDKIIDFDLPLFEELASSPSRPYSLVFFCSAESKMDSPQLQLRALRKEYALTADVSLQAYVALSSSKRSPKLQQACRRGPEDPLQPCCIYFRASTKQSRCLAMSREKAESNVRHPGRHGS